MKTAGSLAAAIVSAVLLAGSVAQSQPASTPRSQAVLDLAGYWVAVITEDWRWRMLTPPKGDYSGVPLNIEGRKETDRWDPARDEASGGQCKAYGAAGIMRTPTRLHISWRDDRTLAIETDWGTQTRILHFSGGVAPSAKPSWTGYSVAEWEGTPGAPVTHGAAPGSPRDLKVVTTRMRSGYLRRNGVPYSENARLTEYFDVFPKQPNGDEWLVVTSVVDDEAYLTEPFITSSHFKREPDAARWHPTKCSAF